MKPPDTGKHMHAEALKHGCAKYWTGEKAFMKRKMSKKRRRMDNRLASPQ